MWIRGGKKDNVTLLRYLTKSNIDHISNGCCTLSKMRQVMKVVEVWWKVEKLLKYGTWSGAKVTILWYVK